MINNITIGTTNFNYYSLFLILSILSGLIYVLIFTYNKKYNKSIIISFFVFQIVFIIFLSKIFTLFTSNEYNLINAPLSSYGGFLGVIIISYIYDKFINFNNAFKYSIISLPLIYGISKIGCFIAGCCYGISYDGILSVTYVDNLNIPLFPIQIVESIVFISLFIILNMHKNNKYIIPITILLGALLKYLLDFLRYDHTIKLLTINQLFSLFIIFITIIYLIIKNKKSKN